MSGNRFDAFRLVLTAPECPQLISDDSHSRSFLGYDLEAERLVEYRVAGGASDDDSAERLRYERRAERWSKVRHAGVATALGWGEWDGSFVVVSEFVDGEPLLNYGERVGALPAELALSVVLQTADIASLAGEHDWLAPLGLNDFAVDYDERDCLRVRLFNVELFRSTPSMATSAGGTDDASGGKYAGGEAAARRWFRRLVVLLEALRSGGVVSDPDAFDALIDEQMPDDGSLASVFDRLRESPPPEASGLSSPPSAAATLMRTLRKGVLAVSGVEEPSAAKCYGFRPAARWAPVGPLPERIYGERIGDGHGHGDETMDLHGGGLADAAFDHWLDSPTPQHWWRPPHRLYGQLSVPHLGVAQGMEVQVQLFPPASYAPGYDQNLLISSMQDSRLRGHNSVVRTYAANWDAELTYTMEEPLDGFRLCDWAARHEDLPAQEVAELMLELSRTLRGLESIEPAGNEAAPASLPEWKWPIDPWAVWVHFGGDRSTQAEGPQGAGGARSTAVLVASPKSEWPEHCLKIRLGPSWERMTLAAGGVWCSLRSEFAEAVKELEEDSARAEAVVDFVTLTVWLAQYESLAAGLRAAKPSVPGVRNAVRENALVQWMREWLPIWVRDGFAGRQIVLHELRHWENESVEKVA